MAYVGELPILESGVDWITVTARHSGDRRYLHRLALKVMDVEAVPGEDPQPMNRRGYKGWLAPGIYAGEREDTYIVELTGNVAWWWWLSLLDVPVNVTRLDLQVTVTNAPLVCDLGIQERDKVSQSGKYQRLARTYSWHGGNDGGSTFYIGAPSSEARLRLYNKTAESEGHYPLGTWRYECQARSSLAGHLVTRLAASDQPALSCQREVFQRFTARGCRPAFRPSGGSLLGHPTRPAATVHRTLRWLGTSVHSAVERLEYAGHGESAISAVVNGGSTRR